MTERIVSVEQTVPTQQSSTQQAMAALEASEFPPTARERISQEANRQRRHEIGLKMALSLGLERPVSALTGVNLAQRLKDTEHKIGLLDHYVDTIH